MQAHLHRKPFLYYGSFTLFRLCYQDDSSVRIIRLRLISLWHQFVLLVTTWVVVIAAVGPCMQWRRDENKRNELSFVPSTAGASKVTISQGHERRRGLERAIICDITASCTPFCSILLLQASEAVERIVTSGICYTWTLHRLLCQYLFE